MIMANTPIDLIRILLKTFVCLSVDKHCFIHFVLKQF